MAEVTYYGAEWCGDCRRSKALLVGNNIEFVEHNVASSAELAAEAESIAGRKNIPVIVFADGSHLVEPTDADLAAALTSRGLL